MSEIVRVCNLIKDYGKIRALDSVDLSVERGELFGLIGPDGAGKSSLYKILSTLAIPDAGTASVLGLDCVKDYKTLRSKIGYMPERFSLYQDLTVMENLRFFASIFNVSVSESFDLIAPVFAQLKRFPDRKAGALSGGMKQKLALCCALIHRPEILLLDEPTTGVDAVSRSEFWEMLGSLRSQGITIMVSTSYMDEASMCGRIAMIHHGRILDVGTPEELTLKIGSNLYAASASDMFRLLETLRKIPGVSDCYTFGDVVHIATDAGFDSVEVMKRLREAGLTDVTLRRAKGNIEDLFIKLIS